MEGRVTIKCLGCDNYARWRVSYKNFRLTTSPPFIPCTIGCNLLCDEHAVLDLINGRGGWHVERIELVDEDHLPIDDRVASGEMLCDISV